MSLSHMPPTYPCIWTTLDSLRAHAHDSLDENKLGVNLWSRATLQANEEPTGISHYTACVCASQPHVRPSIQTRIERTQKRSHYQSSLERGSLKTR